MFKHLSEDEIEKIAREVAVVGQIAPEQQRRDARGVPHDVARLGVRHPRRRRVRAEAADQDARRRTWRAASSIASSSRSSRRSRSPTSSAPTRSSSRSSSSSEHPQTIALLLAHLKPAQAAQLANSLPDELRVEVHHADGDARRDLARRDDPRVVGHRGAAEGARHPGQRVDGRRPRRRRAAQPPRSRRQHRGARRPSRTSRPDLAVVDPQPDVRVRRPAPRRRQRACARSSSAPTRRR